MCWASAPGCILGDRWVHDVPLRPVRRQAPRTATNEPSRPRRVAAEPGPARSCHVGSRGGRDRSVARVRSSSRNEPRRFCSTNPPLGSSSDELTFVARSSGATAGEGSTTVKPSFRRSGPEIGTVLGDGVRGDQANRGLHRRAGSTETSCSRAELRHRKRIWARRPAPGRARPRARFLDHRSDNPGPAARLGSGSVVAPSAHTPSRCTTTATAARPAGLWMRAVATPGHPLSPPRNGVPSSASARPGGPLKRAGAAPAWACACIAAPPPPSPTA